MQLNMKFAYFCITRWYYLEHLSTAVLLVAITLGIYIQWKYIDHVYILIFCLGTITVFCISCLSNYCSFLANVGSAIMHIWIGALMGVITFAKDEQKQKDQFTAHNLMNFLFVLSIILNCFWQILLQFRSNTTEKSMLWSKVEFQETFGLLIPLLMLSTDNVSLMFFAAAFLIDLAALRLRSTIGFFNFIILLIVLGQVSKWMLALQCNLYSLLYFVARHACGPFVQLICCRIPVLDYWYRFFSLNKHIRHTVVLTLFLLYLQAIFLIGKSFHYHKRAFVLLPFFIFTAVVGVALHFILFVSLWKLMKKITDCNYIYEKSEKTINMSQIMAAQSVRQLALILKPMFCKAMIFIVPSLVLGWETCTLYTLGVTMLIFSLEGMTICMLSDLGRNLGGTCIGYALVAPISTARSPNEAKLFTPMMMQKSSLRLNSIENQMNKFFLTLMMNTYGCEKSFHGLDLAHLETKIRGFFQQNVPEGPRYDTYFLYYSGDTYDNGNWALNGNSLLTLETLMQWWQDIDCNSGSRLIIMLDTEHSKKWIKNVSNFQTSFLAIQTGVYVINTLDMEEGLLDTIGEFTTQWVDFNINNMEHSVPKNAVYRVSPSWGDFEIGFPNKQDFEKHWQQNFPIPLLFLVNFQISLGLRNFNIFKSLRNWRMQWFPPPTIDTGHGFSLVSS